MTRAFNRHVDEARAKHAAETMQLQLRRREMTATHAAERQRLDAAQKERWAQETRERQERFNKGFRGLWDRMTGEHTRLRKQNEAEAYATLKRNREQRDELVSAQLQERQQLQVQLREGRQRQAELLHELRRDRIQSRETLVPPTKKAPPEKRPTEPARIPAEEARKKTAAPEQHRSNVPRSSPDKAADGSRAGDPANAQHAAATHAAVHPSPIERSSVHDPFNRLAVMRSGSPAAASVPEQRVRHETSPTPEERLAAMRRNPGPEKSPGQERQHPGPDREPQR